MWNIGVTSVGCGMTATLGQDERQVNSQRLLFKSFDSKSGSKFDPQALF
jgi:hypothetical protein